MPRFARLTLLLRGQLDGPLNEAPKCMLRRPSYPPAVAVRND